jgi:hypothetical protein
VPHDTLVGNRKEINLKATVSRYVEVYVRTNATVNKSGSTYGIGALSMQASIPQESMRDGERKGAGAGRTRFTLGDGTGL